MVCAVRGAECSSLSQPAHIGIWLRLEAGKPSAAALLHTIMEAVIAYGSV
jgi:hypothetical protein